MLGSMFLKLLSAESSYELFAYDKDELDILNYDLLAEKFNEIKPDFLINCAGYTAVDDCEKNQEIAFKLNGEVVEKMAGLCEKIGTTFIHFSTDYVFNGEKKDGYKEEDSPSPINVYGKSKLSGEKAIQENCKKFYIIRTSWLFGKNGKNFVDTMISLGESKPEIDVVNDQIGSPTYTFDLAGAVIENFITEKPAFGIYHLTNSEVCSWYEFALKIFELKGVATKINPVTSDEFVRPAKRPKCSILKNTKLKKLRSYEEALKVYLS